MARTPFSPPTRIALAVAGVCAWLHGAQAQVSTTVTITGRGIAATPSVAGFGDAPLARAPLQASVIGTQQMADAGTQSIGELVRLDASVGDAYDAPGYWSIVSVRGYTLDNRYNYRRDGLPINAETAIGLANKERVEILKGASGIQAGTSAPGGLVNLVVKRPVAGLRTAWLQWREPGSVLAGVDLSDRYGSDGRYGLRLTAEAERSDPVWRNTRGDRHLLALAGDWHITTSTLLQAEVENSHQRQPSVAGYSMLGDVVPAARSIDPRRNLNDQPWRQPVVFDGTTASLKLQQKLDADWTVTAHAMQQRLKSDDRTAFPYGVYDAATYDCPQWCDRYAPDGTFTYWQFISDNERRTSTALQLALSGKVTTAGIEHRIEAGALGTRYKGRFQDQVFDIAGTGRIDGSLVTPPSPGGTDANTNRDERSTELFVRDAMKLTPRLELWAGLRHTRLQREAERTSPDSSLSLRRTDYSRSFDTPFAALSYEVAAGTVAYASWGQGLETDVAPNRSRYANAGSAVTLKSRQVEVGVKHEADDLGASIALFDIDRPQAADLGSCGAAGTCTRAIDGSARHRGVEMTGAWRLPNWTWQGSLMLLDAEIRGATADPTVNGTRPVNVPRASLRAGGEYRPPALPGLALQAGVMVDGDRVVLPGNEAARIPGYGRVDLGARWRQTLAGSSTTLLWRLGVDNATDRRAWKESPYQFGHVYLYPLAPRTWRGSVQASF